MDSFGVQSYGGCCYSTDVVGYAEDTEYQIFIDSLGSLYRLYPEVAGSSGVEGVDDVVDGEVVGGVGDQVHREVEGDYSAYSGAGL